MPETLLTVDEAAERLQMHPDTLRRHLRRGEIRAIKRGPRLWRIPESALEAPNIQAPAAPSEPPANVYPPQTRAKAILEGLHSDDAPTRNAAIIALSHADEETGRIVEEAAARAVEEWQGEEDDLSDWRALDGEPFRFPEEAPDYLAGLYRADAKAEEAAK